MNALRGSLGRVRNGRSTARQQIGAVQVMREPRRWLVEAHNAAIDSTENRSGGDNNLEKAISNTDLGIVRPPTATWRRRSGATARTARISADWLSDRVVKRIPAFMDTFASIDFETANYRSDSACAIGIVVVSGGRIIDRANFLIRPPTKDFVFSYIHGLTWRQVCNAPTFGELWPELRRRLEPVRFLAAHNAHFDRNVLVACCGRYKLTVVPHPFECTMRITREVWSIYPTRLPDVCRRLRIPLQHHEAGSDAEACARIVLAAEASGWRPRL